MKVLMLLSPAGLTGSWNLVCAGAGLRRPVSIGPVMLSAGVASSNDAVVRGAADTNLDTPAALPMCSIRWAC